MRSVRVTTVTVLIAAYAALPILMPSQIFVFTIVLAAGFAGMSVSLLLEAGLLSFGHALFYGIGGYALATLSSYAGNLGLALVLSGAVGGAIVALVTGLFVVRYRGVFFAMLNLALAMVGYSVLMKSYALTGGSDGLVAAVTGLAGHPMEAEAFGRALFYCTLAAVVIVSWLVLRYLKSPAGWALGAIEDREIRVEYLGISANRVLLQTYVLSGFIAGLGGAIAAAAVGHIAPDAMYWTTSTEFVLIAVMGGRGVVGPFLGAGLYELLSITAAQYLSNTWEILLGAVIILVVRFARGGLSGLAEKLVAKATIRGRPPVPAMPRQVL
jgi:branched-chain amino acid transport system permease protein